MTKLKKINVFIAFLCIIAGIIIGAIVFKQNKKRSNFDKTMYHEFPSITDSTMQEMLQDSYQYLLINSFLPKKAQGLVVYDAEMAVNISKYVLSSLFDTPSDIRQRQYEVRKVNGVLWQIDANDVSTNEVHHIIISGKTGAVLELTRN